VQTAIEQTPEEAAPSADSAAELAVVIVSFDPKWLEPCLRTLLPSLGGVDAEVLVVDNSPHPGTREMLAGPFPSVRVLRVPNHGFAHANNRGIEACAARYVLLLNPDTEILEGNFAALVAALEARPRLGLAGVRQVTADGTLWPTIRYFPSVSRAVGEALASERWPRRPRWAGERELDPAAYEREFPCDWTSGSFMLVRREALLAAGLLDERFFLFCEETDLCLRIKEAGWDIAHLPSMTIVHHAGKEALAPRLVAQDAFARGQYARKHFTGASRSTYLGAIVARHLVRAVGSGTETEARRTAARAALRALTGRSGPPFEVPPATAVTPPSGD
jgi:N-acetylglucosaminyl-diphospho-decaprenol L-rhamnosyltransferase